MECAVVLGTMAGLLLRYSKSPRASVDVNLSSSDDLNGKEEQKVSDKIFSGICSPRFHVHTAAVVSDKHHR